MALIAKDAQITQFLPSQAPIRHVVDLYRRANPTRLAHMSVALVCTLAFALPRFAAVDDVFVIETAMVGTTAMRAVIFGTPKHKNRLSYKEQAAFRGGDASASVAK